MCVLDIKIIYRKHHKITPFFYEISTPEIHKIFVSKHIEAIEYVKNCPNFYEKRKLRG